VAVINCEVAACPGGRSDARYDLESRQYVEPTKWLEARLTRDEVPRRDATSFNAEAARSLKDIIDFTDKLLKAMNRTSQRL